MSYSRPFPETQHSAWLTEGHSEDLLGKRVNAPVTLVKHQAMNGGSHDLMG